MARPSDGRSPAAGAFILLIVAALSASAGCGFKIEKLKPRAEESIEPRGFDSPQAAFKWLRTAAEEKNFVAMMECVTDQTAQVFAGHMLISGAMVRATGKPARPIQVVLAKHKIDDDALETIQERLASQIRDPAVIYDLASSIENKRLFVADMMDAFKTLERPLPISTFDADVGHWQIHEDRAIGIIAHEGKIERIAFLRNDLGWQVHFAVRRHPPAGSPGENAAGQPAGNVGATPADATPNSGPEADPASDGNQAAEPAP